MHREIRKSQDYTFKWPFYDLGIQQIPASATVTIKDNGGTTKQTGSGVINTDGTVTFTLLAANNGTVNNNFQAIVSWVDGAETKYHTELFDVTETPLNNEVRDEDLFKYLPELRQRTRATFKTTATGTTTTLKSLNLISDQRNWKGGQVDIYITDTLVHYGRILDYSDSGGVGTITFMPAYTAVIDSGLTFILRTSYQEYIDEAFDNTVYRDVRNMFKRASGFIDSAVLRNLTVYKALEIICFANIEVEGDKWDIRYKRFAELYKDELSSINEPYDNNEDGKIDDGEDTNRPSAWITDVVR